ncbi:MAG: STAS domain-containing protein [Deltaproteobacteria bacterium]|nr:STAS domain-containing protein [Deltaproteobacteria bacterium]
METERIPLLEMNGNLLVSIQRELSDVDALTLQNDILQRLRESGSRGVLLDVSGIEVVDSFIARVFNDIGCAAAALGAQAVLVGLRPAVAVTLVEMDVELGRIRTALTLERALALLGRTPKGPAPSRREPRPRPA